MKIVFALMALGVGLYAICGTIDYLVVTKLPLSAAIVSIGIGILIGFIAVKFIFKLKVKAESKQQYAFGAITALMIIAYTIPLLIAYKSYTLASIYPLIGLSAIVFFVIDLIKYRRFLTSRQTTIMLTGILLVVIGIFFAESNGYGFQIGTIPFVLLITLFGGIGYYMEFYKLNKYSIGTKMLFQPIFLIIAVMFIGGPIFISSSYFAFGILGGIAFSFASVMELHAMELTKTTGTANIVIKRNFINDFEYLDTLLVLIGSIIIGSFYPIEIFGGVLMLTGIIIISRLSDDK